MTVGVRWGAELFCSLFTYHHHQLYTIAARVRRVSSRVPDLSLPGLRDTGNFARVLCTGFLRSETQCTQFSSPPCRLLVWGLLGMANALNCNRIRAGTINNRVVFIEGPNNIRYRNLWTELVL